MSLELRVNNKNFYYNFHLSDFFVIFSVTFIYPFLTLAVNCGNPGIPHHGKMKKTGFTYKKNVTFSCEKYFELRGEKTRECQADGSWSGVQPKCVASKLLWHRHTFNVNLE